MPGNINSLNDYWNLKKMSDFLNNNCNLQYKTLKVLDWSKYCCEVTLLLLVLLMVGCGTHSKPSELPLSTRASIPALSSNAMQLSAPQWCSPTCSAVVATELSSWEALLIKRTHAENNVSPSTQ